MENNRLIKSNYKKAISGLSQGILEDKEIWYHNIINLPIEQQVTYTTVILNQQVFNGGLHQYFINSFGQFAYLTLDNLKLIHAEKLVKILNEAIIAINEDNLPIEQFRRNIYLRQFQKLINFEGKLFDKLDQLDQEYYENNENLEELLVNYLKNEEIQIR